MKNQAIQDKMQNMLDEIIKSGRDTGIQLAVYHKGELVVNAWAGITNLETKELVTEHTMFPVFSTTKGITATMLHILADRGVLNYEQKICELWPEFAKHGKEN
ncbi:MAG: beta-lactamase family protein, partial [Oscillospiraceae bacterium]|nr:beta-lactamase family protein [Oscillospiraceae bacterium]